MDLQGSLPWGPPQAALVESLQRGLFAWFDCPAPLEAGIRQREGRRRLQLYGRAPAASQEPLLKELNAAEALSHR
eukprot:scaffold556_cov221-Pinguiococcus_pyrenoidosus.AAC.9